MPHRGRAGVASEPRRPTAEPLPTRTIAVLPFHVVGNDAALQDVADSVWRKLREWDAAFQWAKVAISENPVSLVRLRLLADREIRAQPGFAEVLGRLDSVEASH